MTSHSLLSRRIDFSQQDGMLGRVSRIRHVIGYRHVIVELIGYRHVIVELIGYRHVIVELICFRRTPVPNLQPQKVPKHNKIMLSRMK